MCPMVATMKIFMIYMSTQYFNHESYGTYIKILQVNGFPTLYLYKEGEKVSEYEGDRSLQDMAGFITQHLSHDEL